MTLWKSIKRIIIYLAILGLGAGYLLWFQDYSCNKVVVNVLDYKDTYKGSAEIVEGKADINIATAETLALIDGIGEKTAEKIIEYRTERGGFGSLEEIQEVSGVGPKTFEKIKDQICLGK